MSNFERVVAAKEKIVNHLANLNDQQLIKRNYPKRYRNYRIRNMQAIGTLVVSGVIFEGSGIVFGSLPMMQTGSIAEIAGLVTGVIGLARLKRLAKIAYMAQNEALKRGIDAQTKTPDKAQEPATPAG